MREKVRDRGRLEHILEAIESIEEFHAQYTFEDIKKNKLIFYGFTKLVEVIGEAVYMLSKESVNSLLELKPFNLILKIPALVNIDTLGSADMTIGKKTYTMKLDGSDYKFGKKTVKKEKFTELYQALQSIMLDS